LEKWLLFMLRKVLLLLGDFAPAELLVRIINDDGKILAQGDVFDVLDLGIGSCAILMAPEIEVAIKGQGSGVQTGLDLADRLIDQHLLATRVIILS